MAGEDGYTRGAMDVVDQKRTFDGFMVVTVWGSALTAAAVLYLTLVFAAGVDPFLSLAAAAGVGVVAGLALRLPTAWYATIAAASVLTLLVTGVVMGLAALSG